MPRIKVINELHLGVLRPGERALVGAPTIATEPDGTRVFTRAGAVACAADWDDEGRLRKDESDNEPVTLPDEAVLGLALHVFKGHDTDGWCQPCGVEDCTPHAHACEILHIFGARPYLL